MKAHGFNMEGPFKGEMLSTLPEWTAYDIYKKRSLSDDDYIRAGKTI